MRCADLSDFMKQDLERFAAKQQQQQASTPQVNNQVIPEFN